MGLQSQLWCCNHVHGLLQVREYPSVRFTRLPLITKIIMILRTNLIGPQDQVFAKENSDILLAAYRAHNASVKALVPKDKLLVYRIGEGRVPQTFCDPNGEIRHRKSLWNPERMGTNLQIFGKTNSRPTIPAWKPAWISHRWFSKWSTLSSNNEKTINRMDQPNYHACRWVIG